jgi:hypothetical protein
MGDEKVQTKFLEALKELLYVDNIRIDYMVRTCHNNKGRQNLMGNFEHITKSTTSNKKTEVKMGTTS